MKMKSIIFTSGIVVVTVQLSIVVGYVVGTGHHHHHRHHHDQSLEEVESAEFIYPNPEYVRNRTVVVGQSEEDQDTSQATGFSEALERRIETLMEKEIRHLCLEEEEDVEKRIRHLGIKCVCPLTEAPVCGSDNFTYFNRCFLHCHARHALLNYHRYRITLKYFGRCGHPVE